MLVGMCQHIPAVPSDTSSLELSRVDLIRVSLLNKGKLNFKVQGAEFLLKVLGHLEEMWWHKSRA